MQSTIRCIAGASNTPVSRDQSGTRPVPMPTASTTSARAVSSAESDAFLPVR